MAASRWFPTLAPRAVPPRFALVFGASDAVANRPKRPRHHERAPQLRGWWIGLTRPATSRALFLMAALGVFLVMTGGSTATAAATRKVVFVCAPNLCAVDGDGANRRQLTADGVGSVDYVSPSLSRDGSRMTFRRADGSAYAADGNAAGARVLGPTDLRALWPRLSADGAQVAWTAIYRGSTTYVVVARFDGSSPPVGYGTFGGEAGFGPGGQFICPQVDKNQLWISPTLQGSDGGACRNSPPATMVANNPDIYAFFGVRPEYAPDNTLIVDDVTPGGQTSTAGIFLYDPASTQLVRQLTTTPGDTNATWSPDGAWIYFDRGANIYRVAPSGGTATLFIAGGTQAAASFDAAGGTGGGTGTGGTGTGTGGTGTGAGGTGTANTGPVNPGPGATKPACPASTATHAKCMAAHAYAQALARCASRHGKARTACRHRAQVAYTKALALARCQTIKNSNQRARCITRARTGRP
jgi:hypothetical protein